MMVAHPNEDGPMRGAMLLGVMALLLGCRREGAPMDATALQEFAAAYTTAWCSQDAARVASFFAEDGSLTINAGTPAIGRAGITASAQGFMTAFPDLVVRMDSLRQDGERIEYHWTLTGTNTGPGGTGRPVRISGFEEWTMGADGLIAASLGHFDEAAYERQVSTAP
jgi:uncharacterized protein (TIGR02246 family)